MMKVLAVTGKKTISIPMFLILVLLLAGCSVQEEVRYDLIPIIMADGELYLDTGVDSDDIREDGMPDGEITSEVDSAEKPTKDGQSNFGSGFIYQYGETEGTIEVNLNGKWRIFATEEVREKMHAEAIVAGEPFRQ